MGNLPSVKDDTFEASVLQSDVPVLVDFSATWCGPCKALAPTLEELSREYDGKVRFFNIDVDEARNTAVKFNVQSVPTVMVFKGGQPVAQQLGNRPKSEIEKMLEKALTS